MGHKNSFSVAQSLVQAWPGDEVNSLWVAQNDRLGAASWETSTAWLPTTPISSAAETTIPCSLPFDLHVTSIRSHR